MTDYNSVHFSERVPKILKEKRLQVSKNIYSVIREHIGPTEKLTCLDLGSSSGLIADYLSRHFKTVVGIDIDKPAVEYAKKHFKRKNLTFYVMSSQNIKFPDNSFDVVICNGLYNCVPSHKEMVSEIHRVLKKDGICYFAGKNKVVLIERVYNLPFLSLMPYRLKKIYVKLVRRADLVYDNSYLSYLGLKKLFSPYFEITDYTFKILRHPKKYHYSNLVKYQRIAKVFPIQTLKFFIPDYRWILKKIDDKTHVLFIGLVTNQEFINVELYKFTYQWHQ